LVDIALVDIETILEDLEHRTIWGICLDVMRLQKAKTEAEKLIERIDDTLLFIEEFVKKYTKDPDIPKEA
jgi:hypothetical protein